MGFDIFRENHILGGNHHRNHATPSTISRPVTSSQAYIFLYDWVVRSLMLSKMVQLLSSSHMVVRPRFFANGPVGPLE